MREWLVIEETNKRSPFASDADLGLRGYIPRDVVEGELGIVIEADGRTTWFTQADCNRMRAHPAWKTEI